MSIISNSFKRNAAMRLVKSLNVEDDNIGNMIVEAWVKGFELAEQMFTEQN